MQNKSEDFDVLIILKTTVSHYTLNIWDDGKQKKER